MTNTPKKKDYLKYILIILSIFFLIFAYSKNKEYNDLKNVLVKEKEDLQIELNQIAEGYKKLNVKNKKLSKRVIREINKIIALKDSVNKLGVKNFDLIRNFRKKTARLQKENRLLLAKVDSLNTLNFELKKENILVNEILDEKNDVAEKLKQTNKTLVTANKKLETEIAPAREVKISAISTIAMKEKNSGGLVKTLKSKRTDAFRIGFTLLENNLANPGNKHIYIQLKDQANNVIAAKEKKLTLKNNTKIKYSDELIVDYQKGDVDILSLILVDRKNITKGKHTVSVFIDGNYISSSNINLK